ncbi:hypothetical protein CR513_01514, partial [Mucuna pruriens]
MDDTISDTCMFLKTVKDIRHYISCLSSTASSSPPKMVSCLVKALSVVAAVGTICLVFWIRLIAILTLRRALGESKFFEMHIALDSNSAGCQSFTIQDGAAPLVSNCYVLLAIFEIRCLAVAGVLSINAPPLAA